MKERLYKKAVKFISFSFVSTTTFAMQLFFTLLFTEIMRLPYYISFGIALVLGWSMNFLFNMKYTFRIEDRLKQRLRRFILIALSSSFLNWMLVLGMVEFLHVHYFISIVLVAFTLSVLTFTFYEAWVFARYRIKQRKARPVES